MERLKDKVAVITGGAGGIGSTTAGKFLDEGAKVLLVDRNEEALQQVVTELGKDNVDYAVADVTQAGDVQAYVNKAVEKFGGIDVFFNNAGIEGEVAPIEDYPEETFDKVIAVNVKGIWLGLKYVMPVMAENGGGSIMITSSVAGLQGTPNVSAYITSKHAVIGTMRTAALEGGPKGIRVNTINPGPVDNRMMRSLEDQFSPGKGEEVKAGFEQQIPLGRYAQNDDVAKLALFLASDDSSYISGCVYPVDGGFHAG